MARSTLLVGYDASSAADPRATGVGRYTRELLRALLATAPPDVEFLVFVNSMRHGERLRRWSVLEEAPNARLVVRRLPGPVLLECWKRLGGPRWEVLSGTRRCGVLHSPAMYLPPADCPRVVTVHDLGFLREARPAALAGGYFRDTFPAELPRCAAVVTPSEFTAEAVRREYGLARERVHAVPSGLPGAFLARGGKDARYCRWDVLGVTAPVERKRPEVLAEALGRMMAARPGLRAAVAGWGDGPHPFPEGVHVYPRLPDVELALLYRMAGVVVLTSREEGFGFPLLESLACGTPVVCGRHSALAEIGEGFAAFVEGDGGAEEYAAQALEVLDRRVDGTQAAAGRRHALSFRWENTAARMVEIYRQAAEGT